MFQHPCPASSPPDNPPAQSHKLHKASCCGDSSQQQPTRTQLRRAAPAQLQTFLRPASRPMVCSAAPSTAQHSTARSAQHPSCAALPSRARHLRHVARDERVDGGERDALTHPQQHASHEQRRHARRRRLGGQAWHGGRLACWAEGGRRCAVLCGRGRCVRAATAFPAKKRKIELSQGLHCFEA
jgi:hypothetical protein